MISKCQKISNTRKNYNSWQIHQVLDNQFTSILLLVMRLESISLGIRNVFFTHQKTSISELFLVKPCIRECQLQLIIAVDQDNQLVKVVGIFVIPQRSGAERFGECQLDKKPILPKEEKEFFKSLVLLISVSSL